MKLFTWSSAETVEPGKEVDPGDIVRRVNAPVPSMEGLLYVVHSSGALIPIVGNGGIHVRRIASIPTVDDGTFERVDARFIARPYSEVRVK